MSPVGLPTMPKPPKTKVEEPQGEDRFVILNLKGSFEERETLRQLSEVFDVRLAVIARRGIALWAKAKGRPDLIPEGWLGK